MSYFVYIILISKHVQENLLLDDVPVV